jgi:hypothetical protein
MTRGEVQQGILVAGLVFDVGEEQVIDQGGPDLDHNGIGRRSQEGFYFEVLLNPFKEQFDIPASLIDLGYINYLA